jgi:hypothetical protein
MMQEDSSTSMPFADQRDWPSSSPTCIVIVPNNDATFIASISAPVDSEVDAAIERHSFVGEHVIEAFRNYCERNVRIVCLESISKHLLDDEDRDSMFLIELQHRLSMKNAANAIMISESSLKRLSRDRGFLRWRHRAVNRKRLTVDVFLRELSTAKHEEARRRGTIARGNRRKC